LRRVYRLPEELRSKLAKPMGRVYSSEEAAGTRFALLARRASMVITVGDRVTETLEQVGRTPDVHVIDGVERRSRRETPKVPFARLVEVKNPAGTLTQSAIEGMWKAFNGKKPVRVQVEGEEDLMAMLAVAMAPTSSLVFYGQPGVGVVAVKVNTSSRTRNRATLAKMGIKGLRSPSS
jgi:GTP-dependent dephospho-CoA kinase